jgi:hypothetical protein
VAELLELAKLLENHDEAQMDVGSGRVYPELDPQRGAALQTPLQFLPRDHVHGIRVDSFGVRRRPH